MRSLPQVLAIGAGFTLLAMGVACNTPTQPANAPSGGDGPAQPKVNRVVLSLDPQATESNQSIDGGLGLRPMYETLLDVSLDTGKFVPMLAESWSIGSGGTSIQFKLRKGVQFHGGRGEMTAKDVDATYDAIATSQLTGTTVTYVRTNVVRRELPNDYEIILHMKQPDSQFLEYVSSQTQGAYIINAAQLAAEGQPTTAGKPIAGTGPYEFITREMNQFLRFKRTDKHWRATPEFPEMEIRWVREPSTRMASLLTGEAHLAALPEDLMKDAEARGMKAIRGKVPAFRAILNFHCCLAKDPWDPNSGYVNPNTPLADVRIRKALNKAINRDELNKAFFGGKGELIHNNPYHPSKPGWNPAWQQRYQEAYGFDVAAAKALVAQAGYGPSNPLKLNLVIQPARGLAAAADVVEAVGAYWRNNLGAEVKLQTIPGTTELRAPDANDHIVMWATSASMWAGTANYGTAMIESNRIWGLGLPDADLVLREIAGTLDDKKADELWRRMGDIYFERYKFIPLHYLPVEIAANPQIVSDYVFPGSISTNWTHLEYLKAAR
jgi:peptide/nickel transport system substrate-binding protein